MIDQHPNAVAGGASGTLALLVVVGLALVGVELPPEAAAGIFLDVTTSVLFVGRNGLRGVGRILWRGRS